MYELGLRDDSAAYICVVVTQALNPTRIVWVMVSFMFMCCCIQETDRGQNDSQPGGGQEDSEQAGQQRG